MSLVYRALWSDPDPTDADALLEQSRGCLARWITDDADATSLDDGEHELVLTSPTRRHRTARLRTVESESLRGLEAVVVDVPRESKQQATTWTTTVRVAVSDDGAHTWIDNAVESDDATLRVAVGRPRLVDDLLDLPGRHMIGGSAVLRSVLPVSAAEVPVIVEVLQDPARTLPYIVFSAPVDPGDGAWLRKAEQTATRTAGVAVTLTLDRDAAAALRAELGDLAVWNGAVRTYVARPLASRADGYQHRYLLPDRLAQQSAVDRLVFAVTQASTRRRVPQMFSAFLTPVVASATVVAGSPADELAEDQVFRLQVDLDGLNQELSVVRGHLERLRTALAERNLDELFWTAHDPAGEDADDLPDEVQDTSDAILTAQQHLCDWLVVPDTAARELDGIDAAANSYSWGNTTWRGLRALALFAQERAEGFQGDFRAWCQSGHPLGWSASTKKLAMRESETVQKNKVFMRARTFQVDPGIDSSGKVAMQAHLKIAEGGGDLAPRVYFYDDTAGVTGKVHVGFIGPHHLVPNTKS